MGGSGLRSVSSTALAPPASYSARRGEGGPGSVSDTEGWNLGNGNRMGMAGPFAPLTICRCQQLDLVCTYILYGRERPARNLWSLIPSRADRSCESDCEHGANTVAPVRTSVAEGDAHSKGGASLGDAEGHRGAAGGATVTHVRQPRPGSRSRVLVPRPDHGRSNGDPHDHPYRCDMSEAHFGPGDGLYVLCTSMCIPERERHDGAALLVLRLQTQLRLEYDYRPRRRL
ncbi:hypothetical protein C8Q76DRAFT_486050 [Earliella scabrosa]|nr:hypothetical protein C8Q76DRAFT_486050 [Earliella scabrosa]